MWLPKYNVYSFEYTAGFRSKPYISTRISKYTVLLHEHYCNDIPIGRQFCGANLETTVLLSGKIETCHITLIALTMVHLRSSLIDFGRISEHSDCNGNKMHGKLDQT